MANDTTRINKAAIKQLSLGNGPGVPVAPVTAAASEINVLAASGVTNAALVKLHAVTSSAAEMSTLHSSGVTNADLVKLHAETVSAAEVNLLTQGVAAGYKIARGVAAITAASQTIVTGLTTVVAAFVSPVTDPTLTDAWKAATIGDQAGSPAAGAIIVTSTKPTSNIDGTPTPATAPWRSVNWFAIGT